MRADPILRPNNFVIANKFIFTIPFLLENPKLFALYSYSSLDPIILADPKGLGLTEFLECAYYTMKISKAEKECRDECPIDPDDFVKWIHRYTSSGSQDDAMLMCTCKKAGPQLCANWAKSCATTPIGIGPSPRLPFIKN